MEIPILKDLTTVAFCNKQSLQDNHEKVLNEAMVAKMYHHHPNQGGPGKVQGPESDHADRCGYDNMDIKATGKLRIAVCNISSTAAEETASSTICHILSLYQRNKWLCQ
ncbi:hypothetical protein P7K49_021908, partial [Saguinus oedipus]